MPKDSRTLETSDAGAVRPATSRAESYAYLFLAVLCLLDFLAFTFHWPFYWYLVAPHLVITTAVLLVACYWLGLRKVWIRFGIMLFVCLLNYGIIFAGLSIYS